MFQTAIILCIVILAIQSLSNFVTDVSDEDMEVMNGAG